MNRNFVISVAGLGARMHYAVPRILYQAGILDRFYTDICAVKGWPKLLHVIPPPLRPSGVKRLLGRVPKGIPPERITTFNWLGIDYTRRLNHALAHREAITAHLWAADRFSDLVLKNGLLESDAIYGFNSGCLKLYRGAKRIGRTVVMEQFSAPRRIEKRYLDSEINKNPLWGNIAPDELENELIQREQESWDLADMIICASNFVREGVIAEGGLPKKCVVVPYGVDLSNYNQIEQVPRSADGPIRVLFIGSVGPGKGVNYLIEAMEQLEGRPVHCRIVGGWQILPDRFLRQLPSNVELVGHVPRAMVAQEYSRADVFCLPSLCEGSATVIYEALAAGLPVITTDNAGSIVRDGIEGYIVPIQDSHAIASRIEGLITNRDLLHTMSGKARERSALGSIEAYSHRLLEALQVVAKSGIPFC